MTYHPMTRAQWQRYEALYGGAIRHLRRVEDAAEAIRRNVDWLLGALYGPVEPQDVADPASRATRATEYGIGDEPINWGDLKCVGAEQFTDGSWQVTVDEVAPGDCPTLCAYIARFMTAWGWRVEVVTEW